MLIFGNSKMKNTTIQIRVEEETKKLIEEKAKQENRSVNNYLINQALIEIGRASCRERV